MAVDVLKSTAVILFNFSAMPTISATNPPQTQSTEPLYVTATRQLPVRYLLVNTKDFVTGGQN